MWLFLHSGSRGVGNKIASTTSRSRSSSARRRWISLPDRDLAYLVEGTTSSGRYIRELRWAQKFALLNREEMMDRVVACFEAWVGAVVEESERINCHHNYTDAGEALRQGGVAVPQGRHRRRRGTPGLIPGSMGTASYVVAGKGNRCR